jgi:hypothetical protein
MREQTTVDGFSALPRTIAGRQETLDLWYAGVPIVCSDGSVNFVPLIDRATYQRLSSVTLTDILLETGWPKWAADLYAELS